jgi:hypothetical protein
MCSCRKGALVVGTTTLSWLVAPSGPNRGIYYQSTKSGRLGIHNSAKGFYIDDLDHLGYEIGPACCCVQNNIPGAMHKACHQSNAFPQDNCRAIPPDAFPSTHQRCIQGSDDELVLSRLGAESCLLQYCGTVDGCCLGLTQQQCACCPSRVQIKHHLNRLQCCGVHCTQTARMSGRTIWRTGLHNIAGLTKHQTSSDEVRGMRSGERDMS